MTFARSPGTSLRCQARSQTAGRNRTLAGALHLILDRGYEDNQTRQLALDFGFIPVIPPKTTAWSPGSMTRPSIASATKWNACFAA